MSAEQQLRAVIGGSLPSKGEWGFGGGVINAARAQHHVEQQQW